jgi:hypothetical protein
MTFILDSDRFPLWTGLCNSTAQMILETTFTVLVELLEEPVGQAGA